ncbi:M4 family metallopeptidase [Fictibacillus sp. Mic-4]|uniref:M4 family metallopeptidase n=1 Tax=Fictibacillus sp. Mic-4 TaxID=3132826 RepID=UPI003CEDE3FB
MRKKLASSTFALSIALGAFATGGTMSFAKESKMEYNKKYATPSIMIENWKAPKGLTKKEVAYACLKHKSKQLKLNGDMKKNFKVVKEVADKKTGTHHFRLVEQLNGVPIYGSDQTISLDKNNQVTSFFGQVVPDLEDKDVSTTASISEKDAEKVATIDIEKQVGEVDHFDGVSKKLYIYQHDGKDHLAYLVKVSLSDPKPGYWHYFVDATNGEIINKYNAIDEMTGYGYGAKGNKEVFEISQKADGKYLLADQTRGNGINTYDAENFDEFWFNILSQLLGYTGQEITSQSKMFKDSAAVDAHVNAEKVYDYYKKTFDRNSFDNKGAKMISAIHVGNKWNNAAWNGKLMMYGDGDGINYSNFSSGIDVIGHELTHAVTEYTANLEYQGESGALNESLSDIMGAMVERKNWDVGEEVSVSGKPLRSMSDPASIKNPLKPTEGYPDHYSKLYKGTQDNGGVHINSSINNKAAYLISEGGTHYGVTVKGVGREATEQIYYRAVSKYLTSTSNFKMMRQAAIQAATDLYGPNSAAVQAVTKAYDAVGVK